MTEIEHARASLRGAMTEIDNLAFKLAKAEHDRDEAIKRADSADAPLRAGKKALENLILGCQEVESKHGHRPAEPALVRTIMGSLSGSLREILKEFP